jgi:S-adenosylmethionine:tRNA ribosyltransferase-isomerase
MKTSLFDFHLPPASIAQTPCEKRDHARLLHICEGETHDRHIYDLPSLLSPQDVLVFNNTKVIPARLHGLRGDMAVEVLLHKQIAPLVWRCFARPAKRLKIGQRIAFHPPYTTQPHPPFSATVTEKCESGEVVLTFELEDTAAFWHALEQCGELPLPPYIARMHGLSAEDTERYQTVYASKAGSVAAPTAGLHFTESLMAACQAKGVEMLEVTLHVGGGTFLPVKVDDTDDHVMHSEYAELSTDVASRLNAAKGAGKRIVAVGTTSLRVLESATDRAGVVHPFAAETDIFITPSYRFKAVDRLLTNFHLPKSTLFMLVCAFSGTEQMKAAYAHAITSGYRFYSYGDACLLERV